MLILVDRIALRQSILLAHFRRSDANVSPPITPKELGIDAQFCLQSPDQRRGSGIVEMQRVNDELA